MSSAQYTLLTEIRDILLSANATDVTNCVNPDGTLFATVTSGNSNNYDYFWYIGSSVTSTPDYTGKNVTGLDMGDYTIVAVDQADPSCTSVPITLTIGDGRMYPELELVPVNPVTNCDASRPNGAAIATANGTDIGFTFDWFVGTGISGSPFYAGSQANGLSAITYTVLATDITTGCTTIEQITIDENFDEMPLPDPEVISHQTSCTTGNGEMAVSVAGNTVDYIFTWYSGQDTSGPAVYTGDLFTGPDPGISVQVVFRKGLRLNCWKSSSILNSTLWLKMLIVAKTTGPLNWTSPVRLFCKVLSGIHRTAQFSDQI